MAFPYSSGDVLTAADLNASSGLVLIATAAATSGTSLAVDGCFDSTFDSYKIVVTHAKTSSALGPVFRLRTSGVDNTSTNYFYLRYRIDYTGTTSSASGTAGTNWPIPLVCDTNNAGLVMDLHTPFAAEITSFSASGTDGRSTGGPFGIQLGGGIFNGTTSFDGFSIGTSAAMTNVQLKVFGYNNG